MQFRRCNGHLNHAIGRRDRPNKITADGRVLRSAADLQSPEIVFVVDLLLGRVRAHAVCLSLLDGRWQEVARRAHHHRHTHAPLHLVQLTSDAGAGHHGGRAASAACSPLERHHFHRLQPYAVRHNETISTAQVDASQSRIISHVRLFQLTRFGAVFLASAGN